MIDLRLGMFDKLMFIQTISGIANGESGESENGFSIVLDLDLQ